MEEQAERGRSFDAAGGGRLGLEKNSEDQDNDEDEGRFSRYLASNHPPLQIFRYA